MVKKNYKLLIGFILGILLSVSGVYAAETIIESINVSYDNSTSGGKYTTVQESIDELYEKSGLLKEKWVDKTLNGADPVFDNTSKLIPITLDDDGTVHYANLYTKWYDYSNKKWANAIILIDSPSTNYKTGDIILEKDIESYFVWIPRYQYKIWDMGNYEKAINLDDLSSITDLTANIKSMFNRPRTIDIVFGNVQNAPKMDESAAKLGSYYTHPAFTLGSIDLNGFWVGKFKTGINGTSSDNGVEDGKKIIIKPGVSSWRDSILKTFFDAGYNYERNLDSHILKNTEWGAVAYLSHSAYGIGTKININNTSNYMTGYSAVPDLDKTNNSNFFVDNTNTAKTKPYNTEIGYLASTTGNITGVYDMSGGAWEYVAACIKGMPKNSGFTTSELENYINQGYIDGYKENSNIATYNNRILGDATGEMGPFYVLKERNNNSYLHTTWYNTSLSFIDSVTPWFCRGGLDIPELMDQFGAFRASGNKVSWSSFRIALSIKNS